jgi:hypothetical protein|tara:strand:+ start:1917 stop:2138 length:222 start_codon:yes stop_codon:yes gene_type:complete
MKKNLLILVLLFSYCSKETGCVEIKDKAAGGGEYLFYWSEKLINLKNQSIIRSGNVTEEIYNSFEIGDEYCIE